MTSNVLIESAKTQRYLVMGALRLLHEASQETVDTRVEAAYWMLQQCSEFQSEFIPTLNQIELAQQKEPSV
jgi:hypothetical protein